MFDVAATHDDRQLEVIVEQMAAALANRGPDGSGTWVDAARGVGLGHRRLSVLDLSDAGSQPMTSRDGRWVIVFNGEIYNHCDLMARLEATGTVFRGHCDTEVLLEGIATWGLRPTLEAVEGMFAFGLWDRSDRRLTLVRDRLGEKPLYWGRAGSGFVFGSGLDALTKHPGFDRTIDPDALCGMLRYKYVPTPLSIYRDAYKLPPGCLLEIDRHGAGEPEVYWSFKDIVEQAAAHPYRGSAADAARELEMLLRDSIKNRLLADVPVGAFLSGGIDSSTIVAIMSEVSSERVRTFTIGSADSELDESTHARRVAEYLGTDHHEIIVDGSHALAVVDELPSIYDEPFGDSSQIPTYLVSRLARESVTVALSGDGGDELFGGYNRYHWLPMIERRSAAMPAGVRSRLAQAVELAGADRIDLLGRVIPARVRPRQLGLKAQKFASVASLDSPEAMYLRVISHWSDPVQAVRHGHDPAVMASLPDRWPSLTDSTERMMAVDLLTYLPDDILTKVDRATMAVGLEGRIPFLDRRVVEFAASLPSELRTSGGLSKRIVRDVLYPKVPRELLERPKAGFGIPLDEWLRGPLRSWGEELLSDPQGGEYLNRGVVRAVWHEHQRGVRNHGHRLWDVLMFLAWADRRRAC